MMTFDPREVADNKVFEEELEIIYNVKETMLKIINNVNPDGEYIDRIKGAFDTALGCMLYVGHLIDKEEDDLR